MREWALREIHSRIRKMRFHRLFIFHSVGYVRVAKHNVDVVLIVAMQQSGIMRWYFHLIRLHK